jgi:zinc protease
MLVNGATGWFQSIPGFRRSNLSVLLPLGPMQRASSTLLGSVLLEGSPQTKAHLERARSQGFEFTVLPAGDKTLLNVSGPLGQEAALVGLAMTVLTQPQADAWTFQTQRENLLKNLEKTLTLPEMKVANAIGKVMFGPTHPYGTTVPELMGQIRPQTLASVLAAHAQALSYPEQAQWMMISPKPVAEQAAMLNQALQGAGLFRSPYRGPAPMGTPPVVTPTGRTTPVFIPDETMQRGFVLNAWRIPPPSDADYPAFMVLFTLLNGFSGRFFDELRTRRGLVYSARQSVEHQQQASHYSLITEIDFDKLPAGLTAIEDVVRGLLSAPPTPAELSRAKKTYKLEVRNSTQSANGLAEYHLGRVALSMPPLAPELLLKQIDHVTPQDVLRVATRIFSPQSATRIIGMAAPPTQISTLQHWFAQRQGMPQASWTA